MTVPSEVNSISYSGNGTTTAFAIPYYFLENSHIKVILRSSAGVETLWVINVNYTLTGAGVQAGGTLTATVAPAAGTTLVISRSVPATQETDYPANDPFPSSSHERALDKLTMLQQQNSSGIKGAIRVPDTDSEPNRLPTASIRASLLLGFDSSGQPIAVAPTSGSAVDLATSLANSGDVSKGAGQIGRAGQVLKSIAELRNLLKISVSKHAFVTGYSEQGDDSGGPYYLDSADTTSADNGVTIIVATDGGRWKLLHNGVISLKQAGGKEDGITDDLAAWNRLLALTGIEIVFSGTSVVSGPVTIVNNNTSIRGITKAATIQAKASTNFEHTLYASNKSGIFLKDFTVDANKANRESVLTTRTTGVTLDSCTDCDVVGIIAKNAIGTASIPGIGISLAGTGNRIKISGSRALDCGVTGKAADGFYCSASNSILEGNIAVNCLDTGHVLESCSNSGIVGCTSITCGVVGAITNATSSDTFGNYINGLTGKDWNAAVTGGVQISALSSGHLFDTIVTGLNMVGITNFVGPAINVRKTSTGIVKGLTIDTNIRNASTQGILIDSAERVTVKASIVGTTNACIQVNGNASDIVIQSGTNLKGGTFGVFAGNTASVLVQGIHSSGASNTGIYAADTSTITSLMNDIKSPGSAYEGKDAGATLERLTLINGFFSMEKLTGSAPSGTLSDKFTNVNKAGASTGVVPIYTA